MKAQLLAGDGKIFAEFSFVARRFQRQGHWRDTSKGSGQFLRL